MTPTLALKSLEKDFCDFVFNFLVFYKKSKFSGVRGQTPMTPDPAGLGVGG
jgi:hypothetical protein